MTATALTIRPARRLTGCVQVPGDKSISHRYLMLGAVARGTTRITGLSTGADVAATAACLRALGVSIRTATGPSGITELRGRAGSGLAAPGEPLDAANSGTTLRLLAGILAAQPFTATISGDRSLRRRPMARIIDPLTAMGARVRSTDGGPPLEISGGALQGITWRPSVPSAQVKSAILLAGLWAAGLTRVKEPAATRDHTERAFAAFGLNVETSGLTASVRGPQVPTASDRLRVPGDPSAAAVWAAGAAALPGSAVVVEDICLNPRRLGFLEALSRMGAVIETDVEDENAGEPRGTLAVQFGERRRAVIMPDEVPGLIDELPVLAACAALGGGLEVSGAAELRVKESDRITALVSGLRALGVQADERPDGFVIDGSRQPSGGTVDAAGDHRLVMAFALVGLGAAGPVTITGADVVGVSYPRFEPDLGSLIA